jgi:hypothetical protein
MARVIRWDNVHDGSTLNQNWPWPPVSLTGTLRDDNLGLPFALFAVNTNIYPTSALMGSVRNLNPYGFNTAIYGDVFFLLGALYFKYQAGAMFFNAEYDFQYIDVRRMLARPVSGYAQAWAAESGFVAGPIKVSLAHFYRSGHDRRHFQFYPAHSLLVFSSPYFRPNDKWDYFLTAWGAGEAPIKPYNFLLGLYGTGNNSYNSAGTCTYQDFLAYAARIDYAVAANLNVYASFIHAERASNTGTAVATYDGWSWHDRVIGEVPHLFFLGTVPDNNLGDEVDFGLAWKLLEGLTFKFRFAYWQPGNWFKFAYVDRSRTPRLNRRQGIGMGDWGRANPGRTVDPIIAIQSSLLWEF